MNAALLVLWWWGRGAGGICCCCHFLLLLLLLLWSFNFLKEISIFGKNVNFRIIFGSVRVLPISDARAPVLVVVF